MWKGVHMTMLSSGSCVSTISPCMGRLPEKSCMAKASFLPPGMCRKDME